MANNTDEKTVNIISQKKMEIKTKMRYNYTANRITRRENHYSDKC